MAESEAPKPPIITPEAMERWGSLPLDAPLYVPLTKVDLDHLFLAIRESIISQSNLGAVILALSNGEKERADAAFLEARTHLDNSITHMDNLIVRVMTTAEPIEHGK